MPTLKQRRIKMLTGPGLGELNHWILAEDQRTPLAVDLLTWAEWFERGKTSPGRITASDHHPTLDITVSTVFLGIDYNFGGSGPPLLWETMIFGGPEDGYTNRYSTWEDAMAGHAKALDITKISPPVSVYDKIIEKKKLETAMKQVITTPKKKKKA